jgi:Fe-S-cluster containining protein
MQDLPGGHVVPLTETGKCPFLKEDLGCNIYKNRPEICMKFGDETHINMTCAYQTKNGRARSTKETMKINTSQQAYLNNYL